MIYFFIRGLLLILNIFFNCSRDIYKLLWKKGQVFDTSVRPTVVTNKYYWCWIGVNMLWTFLPIWPSASNKPTSTPDEGGYRVHVDRCIIWSVSPRYNRQGFPSDDPYQRPDLFLCSSCNMFPAAGDIHIGRPGINHQCSCNTLFQWKFYFYFSSKLPFSNIT
jgi:hypothetical protein